MNETEYRTIKLASDRCFFCKTPQQNDRLIAYTIDRAFLEEHKKQIAHLEGFEYLFERCERGASSIHFSVCSICDDILKEKIASQVKNSQSKADDDDWDDDTSSEDFDDLEDFGGDDPWDGD